MTVFLLEFVSDFAPVFSLGALVRVLHIKVQGFVVCSLQMLENDR
jgi:acetolactate synthase regulatory subunit